VKKSWRRFPPFFGSNCEVIADYGKVHSLGEFSSTEENVLELLRLRPCSVDDISAGLGLHRNEAVKYVQELVDKKIDTNGGAPRKKALLRILNHNKEKGNI